MNWTLLTLHVRYETDFVQARQSARQLAEILGFSDREQTRIATAVSEVARNALNYAGGGKVEFLVDGAQRPPLFLVRVSDRGPGIADLSEILEGRYKSQRGLGVGLAGTKRLMDHFDIQSEPGRGTTVSLGRRFPSGAAPFTDKELARVTAELARRPPQNPAEEVQRQNQDLLAALADLRQNQEELLRVNRELEEKTVRLLKTEQSLRARNDELKAFAYTVSHDLKAPLRGIAGYAQELDRRHRAGLSERAVFCLNQIMTATRNLDHLIEDLLHYSRLDAESPSLTEVELGRVVETILRDRSHIIAERKVEIGVDLRVRAVHGWERGITQVLTNLIDNAVKYSRDAQPPSIRIHASELPEAWRITVQDNGIGFDMKYHDRIFGLFNRLVRPEQFEGTGAGLAIVKKLVEKQGGRIWAESEPGRGATFFVELPKQQPEA
ncbi:MAG: ATP-binding protein [Acidobacteria bacterium]|nr:ATP-binding protein [Acidobacteriota bacterium]